MHGRCGTLISKMGVARLPTQAHSSAGMFDELKASNCVSEIASIIAERTLGSLSF